jgi:hypothetical protein
MAVTILSLASGPLPTSKTTIYTSPTTPSALTTIVKSIRLVNTAATPTTVNIYLFRPADNNDRRIFPQNMSVPAGGLAIDDQEITMTSGDLIKADCSASGIDYVISGIQR